jgi:endoglucanase
MDDNKPRRIDIACLMIVALLAITSFLRADNPQLAFWDTPRKGANGSCGDATEEWFTAAAETGIEFVRLSPTNLKSGSRDFLLGDADKYEGIPKADYDMLRAVLDRAERHKIKVVLTMFSLPGARWRQQNNDQFDYRLWQDEAYHHQAAAFWKDLAQLIGRHPAVVGFNPLNEPHPERQAGFESPAAPGFDAWLTTHTGSAADLNLFYRRIVKAIREVDATTPIVLDARFHANPAGFRSLQPIDDPAVLYSFHFYEPWTYTTFRVNKGRFRYPDRMPGDTDDASVAWTGADFESRLAPVRVWAEQHGVPANRILAAEFGCNRQVAGARDYLSDVIGHLNHQGWHWAFYSFRSADWDGMDYELGPGKLGWNYWKRREAGEPHEVLIERRSNPLWDVIAREFRADTRQSAHEPPAQSPRR